MWADSKTVEFFFKFDSIVKNESCLRLSCEKWRKQHFSTFNNFLTIALNFKNSTVWQSTHMRPESADFELFIFLN